MYGFFFFVIWCVIDERFDKDSCGFTFPDGFDDGVHILGLECGEFLDSEKERRAGELEGGHSECDRSR